jgi:hypothetical protein
MGKKGLKKILGPFHHVWYTLKDFHPSTCSMMGDRIDDTLLSSLIDSNVNPR